MPWTAPDLIAGLLVEADLMGHTTHGLALLPGYLEALAAGTMAARANLWRARHRPLPDLDGRRPPGVDRASRSARREEDGLRAPAAAP